MAKISMKEAIKLTAQYVGCSQEVASTVIEAYAYIIYKLLLEGYDVRMPLLGRFYLQTKPEQPAKTFKLPQTGETMTLPPKQAYQKPSFLTTGEYRNILIQQFQKYTLEDILGIVCTAKPAQRQAIYILCI